MRNQQAIFDMTEKRNAYRIEAGDPPTITVYDCVITHNRIAVYRQYAGASARYYEPKKFPGDGMAAWTLREAWERFRTAQQQKLERLRDEVETTEQQVTAADRELEKSCT